MMFTLMIMQRKLHILSKPNNSFRIIPNKRTPPNKRPPPFSTRQQPSACSRVNIVEPRSMRCERGCKRGMLLLHVA